MPYKLMPQKSNNHLKEKCPFLRVGTLKSTHIDQKHLFYIERQHLRIRKRNNYMKFSEYIKMIMVVDKWLHSLTSNLLFLRLYLKQETPLL